MSYRRCMFTTSKQVSGKDHRARPRSKPGSRKAEETMKRRKTGEVEACRRKQSEEKKTSKSFKKESARKPQGISLLKESLVRPEEPPLPNSQIAELDATDRGPVHLRRLLCAPAQSFALFPNASNFFQPGTTSSITLKWRFGICEK